MKTKFLILISLFAFVLTSCEKDEEIAAESAEEVAKVNAEMDVVSDDISKIVENELEAQVSGRMAATATTTNFQSWLPDCATITIVANGNNITRTVDFGTVGCQLPNGNILKGKIITSFTHIPGATTHVVSYTFDNFYHNNKKVEGNRTVTRTILATGHPQATIDLNMTITYPNGNVYTRVGQRVREFVEGYNTLPWTDNVYKITGSWNTTFPSGNVRQTTITEPLRVRLICNYIVKGIMQITIESNVLVINWGDGACDAVATGTLNGGTPFVINL